MAKIDILVPFLTVLFRPVLTFPTNYEISVVEG